MLINLSRDKLRAATTATGAESVFSSSVPSKGMSKGPFSVAPSLNIPIG